MKLRLKQDVNRYIKKKFGARCKDYDRNCVVCKAYKAIETIFE